MAKVQNDMMDKLVALCKGRGFVFPGSEIYGGLANSWVRFGSPADTSATSTTR